MTIKKLVPNLLCRRGTPGNGYVLPPTPGEIKGAVRVWKLIGSETQRVKHEWEYLPGQCKDNQKVGAWMHNVEGKHHEDARVKIRRWSLQDNSRYVSALSSWHVIFHCSTNAVDSAFILCYFSRWLPKNVVANKLCVSEQRHFLCSSTFPTKMLQSYISHVTV